MAERIRTIRIPLQAQALLAAAFLITAASNSWAQVPSDTDVRAV
jgi:hypothetical protein